MDQPSRIPLVVGVILIACGWAVIGLGWWQAGRQELETGQIPYVVSGGFGGLGLILLGTAGVLVDAIQRTSWLERRSSAELGDAIGGLRSAVEARLPEEPQEPEAEPEEPPARRRKSTSGRRGRPRSR
jgi:hypothetical protein